MFNDFNDMVDLPVGKGMGKAGKRARIEESEQRSWLRVYETLPAQMLNAYGVGRYTQLSDKDVWGHMVKPLKTGAAYMTEYAAKEDERRGVAINRWLLSVLTFCQYQRRPGIKRQNESLLIDKKCEEMYKEIDHIYEALEYCLAPKKVGKKTGASVLRGAAQVSDSGAKDDQKSPEALEKHGKVLFEWVTSSCSRIRMLMNWQAAGALSYVASVHHRATQCFVLHGNQFHDGDGDSVSLTEFQSAVKARHRIGSAGISDTGDGLHDFN